jgi:predicted aspartyl protease
LEQTWDQMNYLRPALSALLTVLAVSAAVAGTAPFRCTDDSGLVLLTSDARATDVCKVMSAAARQCVDGSCPVSISKDQAGRLYINGTVNGTRVTYPVAAGARSSTLCIRDQCKAR